MTDDPQPVRLMAYVRRYGLLHPDGVVQVGSGGPFLRPGEAGPLKKASREEFEAWLLEKPVTENGGYALKKRKAKPVKGLKAIHMINPGDKE